MKINIEKAGDHFRADCLDLPGSPPVGVGKTKEMAVAHMFYQMYFSDMGGPDDGRTWMNFLKEGSIEIGKNKWEYPKSYGTR